MVYVKNKYKEHADLIEKLYLSGYGITGIIRELPQSLDAKSEGLRRYIRRQPYYRGYGKTRNKKVDIISEEDKVLSSSQNTNVNTGEITSKIVVRRKDKHPLNQDDILRIHGFDTSEFKLKAVVSNEWTTPIAGDAFYNYQSKIIVEPITTSDIFTPAKIAEIVNNLDIKPIPDIRYAEYDDVAHKMLYLPLSDMHFGLNNAETFNNINNYIFDKFSSGNQYEKVVISIHGDFFHTDNFKSTTEKGTQLDTVDFQNQITSGIIWLTTVIDHIISSTLPGDDQEIEIIYLKGNHAPSIDYMLMEVLKQRYKDVHQLRIDSSLKELKVSQFYNVSLFMHHGDKIRQNKLISNIVSNYSAIWGRTSSRYIFTGHFHHEKSLADSGAVWYQLSSPSEHSNYEKDYGFATAPSEQMVFEFDLHKRRHIDYI